MKNALIAGGSEGIGRSFAQQLAAEGYTITAVARNEANLKNIVSLTGGMMKPSPHVNEYGS